MAAVVQIVPILLPIIMRKNLQKLKQVFLQKLVLIHKMVIVMMTMMIVVAVIKQVMLVTEKNRG